MDILEKLKALKYERFDLADYLIHFTRQNEKSSFDVLKDIVISGRINCNWSVRGVKRTIFGEKPAICFTDMPLYSFYRYVQNRRDINKVDFYGVAIHKTKMFNLGARNVIYGTTGEGEPEEKLENGDWINSRLPSNEQYRYMLTNINDVNDWTHEREWRWANHYNKSKGDYLPIWINNTYEEGYGDIEFYQEKGVFIIVRYDSQIDELLKIFSDFTDEVKYNISNIKRTFIISLETLRNNNLLSYDKLEFISLIRSGYCKKVFE